MFDSFCSHNEVDLEPAIVSMSDSEGDDVDWAVVRCTCCKRNIGKRYRLIDLVDKAIKARKERRDALGDE